MSQSRNCYRFGRKYLCSHSVCIMKFHLNEHYACNISVISNPNDLIFGYVIDDNWGSIFFFMSMSWGRNCCCLGCNRHTVRFLFVPPPVRTGHTFFASRVSLDCGRFAMRPWKNHRRHRHSVCLYLTKASYTGTLRKPYLCYLYSE